jgi:hypothetical protein
MRGGVRVGDHGVRQLEIEGGLAEPDDAAGVVPSEHEKSSRDQVLTWSGRTRDNAQAMTPAHSVRMWSRSCAAFRRIGDAPGGRCLSACRFVRDCVRQTTDKIITDTPGMLLSHTKTSTQHSDQHASKAMARAR